MLHADNRDLDQPAHPFAIGFQESIIANHVTCKFHILGAGYLVYILQRKVFLSLGLFI